MGRIIVSGKSQLFDDVSVRDAEGCSYSAARCRWCGTVLVGHAGHLPDHECSGPRRATVHEATSGHG